jgi:hypothetical protein
VTKDYMGVKIARKNIQSKWGALRALIITQVRRSTRDGVAGTVATLDENSQLAIVENTDGIGVTKDDGRGAPDQGENDESKQNICLVAALSEGEATNASESKQT